MKQDGQIATLSSQVQQLLQQAPSGFLPRAFYGLTRGNMTYRFINENIFTIQGLTGEIGDAYEILSRLEPEAYINAVAVQINTNQIKIIIQGDYTIRTNVFDLVNMRTGYTLSNIELTNTNLMDASYLGEYDANENKQKQITILHDLESGKDNVVFASLDYSEDTIYNWVRIGGYTDGLDGKSIFGITSATASIVLSTIKVGDLILAGETFSNSGINFNAGDLKEIISLTPLTTESMGNIRGVKGEKGDPGTNGINGQNGITPSIGANNNWFIGEVDTGINAQGLAGLNGVDGNSFDIQSGLFSTIENESNPNNLSPEGDPLNMLPTLPQTNISGKAYVVYDPITTPLEPFYCLYWANNGDADWTVIKPYTGIAGKDGRDGSTPYIENNNWYINGQNTGVPVTGPQGPQGIQGEKGLNTMGLWIEDNEYYVDDLVTYNGSAYLCIRNNQGSIITPDLDATNWTLFVSKGDKGDTGNTGPSGPTPNISVTVNSLPSTSQPTATTTGTAENPIINLGIPSANNIVYVTINAPETATQGTLTENEVNLLLSANENYIIFANEVYKLQDKQVNSGYLVYTHTGKDSMNQFYIKCITITVSTFGWVLSTNNVASKQNVNSVAMCIKDGYKERYALSQNALVEGQVLYYNNYGVNSWAVVRINTRTGGTIILSLRNSQGVEILGWTLHSDSSGDTNSILIPLPTYTQIVVGNTTTAELIWGDVTVVETREV